MRGWLPEAAPPDYVALAMPANVARRAVRSDVTGGSWRCHEGRWSGVDARDAFVREVSVRCPWRDCKAATASPHSKPPLTTLVQYYRHSHTGRSDETLGVRDRVGSAVHWAVGCGGMHLRQLRRDSHHAVRMDRDLDCRPSTSICANAGDRTDRRSTSAPPRWRPSPIYPDADAAAHREKRPDIQEISK